MSKTMLIISQKCIRKQKWEGKKFELYKMSVFLFFSFLIFSLRFHILIGTCKIWCRIFINSPNCDSFSRSIKLKTAPFLFRTPHLSGIPMDGFDFVSTISVDFKMQHVSKKSGHGWRSGSGSSSPPKLFRKTKQNSTNYEIFPFFVCLRRKRVREQEKERGRNISFIIPILTSKIPSPDVIIVPTYHMIKKTNNGELVKCWK